MTPFSTWLYETMDNKVEEIPGLAEEWGITHAEALDYLTRKWWEYVETSLSSQVLSG